MILPTAPKESYKSLDLFLAYIIWIKDNSNWNFLIALKSKSDYHTEEKLVFHLLQ